MIPSDHAGEKFQGLVGIIRTLRGPDGCPWDREQDVGSIVGYFLEEAYEAAEACLSGTIEAAAEELGDVLMEVVFLAGIFEEQGRMSVADALEKINTKMVDRHPHVFGGATLDASAEVVDEWQRRKLREKGRTSVLDGLGTELPGLFAAFQIGRRAAAFGFDWPGAAGVLEKLKEEIRELEGALEHSDQEAVAEEMGDLLFAAANLSRHLGINPELAVRRASRKFSERFRKLEKRLGDSGRKAGEVHPEEMENIWEQIKK